MITNRKNILGFRLTDPRTKFVYLYVQIDTFRNLNICEVTGGRDREC